MKKFVVAAAFAVMVFTGCSGSSWYKGHPTTKDELVDRMGPPHSVTKIEGMESEQWVYVFESEGTHYMYYLIEDGMVVRTGMK